MSSSSSKGTTEPPSLPLTQSMIDSFEANPDFDGFEIQFRKTILHSDGINTNMEGLEYWKELLVYCHSTIESNQHDALQPSLIRLVMIVLEDLLDISTLQTAYQYYCGATSHPLLFSNVFWKYPKHPAWLGFLKLSNGLSRRLLEEEMYEENSSVILTLSTVYPMSDKSAIRNVGTYNEHHPIELQDEDETDSNNQEHPQNNSSNKVADASFYEKFWTLQRDFSKPTTLHVKDFLNKLQVVVASLEPEGTFTSSHSLPFLTHRRLLRYQLKDVTFRNIVLSQFWMISHHLLSLLPSLKPQLLALLERTHEFWDNPLSKTQLLFHDSQWRQWKLNKCQPDLEQAREMEPSLPRKRKQPSTMPLETSTTAPLPLDLKAVSRQMRGAAPPFKEFMNEYAEALDPDAGIEAEYHPKNNKLYCWRAIRTVSPFDMAQIQLNGDLERLVRQTWATDIPGTCPPPMELPESESEDKEPMEDHDDDAQDKSGTPEPMQVDTDEKEEPPSLELKADSPPPEEDVAKEAAPKDDLTKNTDETKKEDASQTRDPRDASSKPKNDLDEPKRKEESTRDRKVDSRPRSRAPSRKRGDDRTESRRRDTRKEDTNRRVEERPDSRRRNFQGRGRDDRGPGGGRDDRGHQGGGGGRDDTGYGREDRGPGGGHGRDDRGHVRDRGHPGHGRDDRGPGGGRDDRGHGRDERGGRDRRQWRR